MKVPPEAVRGEPVEIDMDPLAFWRWRIVIIGDGWTAEQHRSGPKWLVKRHVRRLFHELRHV